MRKLSTTTSLRNVLGRTNNILLSEAHLPRLPCQKEVTTARNSNISSIWWTINSTEGSRVVTSTTDSTRDCPVKSLETYRIRQVLLLCKFPTQIHFDSAINRKPKGKSNQKPVQSSWNGFLNSSFPVISLVGSNIDSTFIGNHLCTLLSSRLYKHLHNTKLNIVHKLWNPTGGNML